MDDPDKALKYFAHKRSSTDHGVVVPSQIRYVRYFKEAFLGNIDPLNQKKLILRKLIMRPIPHYSIDGGCRPYFEIYDVRTAEWVLLFSSRQEENKRYTRSDFSFALDINVLVQGDILIRAYHQTKTSQLNILMFRFNFHTSFIKDYKLDLRHHELDGILLASMRFDEYFCIRLMFAPIESVPAELIRAPSREILDPHLVAQDSVEHLDDLVALPQQQDKEIEDMSSIPELTIPEDSKEPLDDTSFLKTTKH